MSDEKGRDMDHEQLELFPLSALASGPDNDRLGRGSDRQDTPKVPPMRDGTDR